jgi:glycine/D-amino acid oxidase-like deaminating enzyme
MGHSAEVLICGAGIAGVSAAYHLAVRQGVRDVILVDENAPLSLTSDHSTECYRNWWPGPGDSMVALMNRSIDLLEELAAESGNVFHLNRRGYLYCSADPAQAEDMRRGAEEISELGAGPLRVYTGAASDPVYLPAAPQGFEAQPTGADLILDPGLIQTHYPYLSKEVIAALHVRRAGWLSAQQLGMYLLEQARAQGVKILTDKVISVDLVKGQVGAVHLQAAGRVPVQHFVNTAGPFLKDVGQLLGVEIPVTNELHLKVAMKDSLGVLDRAAPLVIWSDAQTLAWTEEERDILAQEDEFRWMLEQLPPGVHTRPEGVPEGQIILVLWEYHTRQVEPVWPIPLNPEYPDMVLRGLVKMIPGMRAYLEKAPRPRVDGGYYTKTQENRPLIGKLPVEGAYVLGALSGFGIMAACAAGDLLAAHVTGDSLPPYAPAFALERYQDAAYQRLLKNWETSGQL